MRTQLLLVHRDPATLSMLEAMLHGPAFEVAEATDDRAAVKMLAAKRPGLILMGVDPDEPDALELLSHSHRHYPSVPSLLMLSKPHDGLGRQALRMGATAVLRFPLPANQLRASVLQALRAGEEAQPATRTTAVPPVLEPPRPQPESARSSSEASVPRSGPVKVAGDPDGPCSRRVPWVGRRVGADLPVEMPIGPLKETLEGPEREYILHALKTFDWNRNRTAEALDLNRTTLYKKMKKYGLLEMEPPGWS